MRRHVVCGGPACRAGPAPRAARARAPTIYLAAPLALPRTEPRGTEGTIRSRYRREPAGLSHRATHLGQQQRTHCTHCSSGVEPIARPPLGPARMMLDHLLLLLSLLVLASANRANTHEPDPVLGWPRSPLADLPPLPKTHLSWGLAGVPYLLQRAISSALFIIVPAIL